MSAKGPSKLLATSIPSKKQEAKVVADSKTTTHKTTLDNDSKENNKLTIQEKKSSDNEQSRVPAGTYFVYNLDLVYGSKKTAKQCTIPDKWDELDQQDKQKLTLHNRLAISEALISSNTDKLIDINNDDSSNNYVVANLGFIVSTKKHVKDGNHNRRFITVPVVDPGYLTIRSKPSSDSEAPHSEKGLYEYLKNPKVIQDILSYLTKRYGIEPGFKIYGVVLDIHSSNAMCANCEDLTYKQSMREQKDTLVSALETEFIKQNYILPKLKTSSDALTPKTQRLHFVARVSGSKRFLELPRPKDTLGNQYPSITDKEEFDRDIRKFKNSVIVHTFTVKGEAEKYRKRKSYAELLKSNGYIAGYKHTAFVNYRDTRVLKDIDRDSKEESYKIYRYS